MRRKIFWLCLTTILAGYSLSIVGCRETQEDEDIKPKVDWEIRGFTLVCRYSGGLSGWAMEEATDWMKEMGVNSVELDLWLWQNGASANYIYPWEFGIDSVTWIEKDKKLLAAIECIHEKGLKAFLKLNIHDKNNSCPPRSFDPSNPELWFKNYSKLLFHYASLAQANNIEMFCLGNELATLTYKYPGKWIGLIDSVKQRFKGQLTYAALNGSHYGNIDGPDAEYRKLGIEFWGKLDYIGINAWFPVSAEATPSVDSVMRGWQNWMDTLLSWQAIIGKKIIFTEIGYRSIDFCGKEPWSRPNTDYNGRAQANCYKGLFQIWGKEQALAGIFLFEYWPGGNYGIGDPGYTPRDKPAEGILKEYYRGQ